MPVLPSSLYVPGSRLLDPGQFNAKKEEPKK
jgi:hypothetical protein